MPKKLYNKQRDSYAYWTGIAYKVDDKLPVDFIWSLRAAKNYGYLPVEE